MEPRQILAALADLAPATGERVLDVARGGQPLIWLAEPNRAPGGRAVDRLAALDALHREERILRRGWGFVVGGVDDDGVRRTVRLPLLIQPVRLDRALRGYRVVAAGDLELTPIVGDRETAARLEAAPGIGEPTWLSAAGTAAWIRSAAQAAGLELARVAAEPPRKLPEDELLGVVAAALFVVRDVRSAGLRDTLLTWAGRRGLEFTALAFAYGLVPAAEVSTVDGDVRSPLPLNAAQREVVRRARTEPVVAATGPPGTGKSHAVIAAAVDVVDRGGSVLIAAQSSHAVDALRELLRRYPGAAPVLFGDAERREAIAAELSQGLLHGISADRLRADAEAVEEAAERATAVRVGIATALEIERRAADLPRWEPLLPGLRIEAPGAFEVGFDVAKARRLAGRRGWFARWRLRRRLGASAAVPPGVLDAAAASQAAALLAATGGTDLGPAWPALFEADAALATAVGTAMRDRATAWWRLDREARRSAVALAAALQAGRNRRRELLAGLDGPALVRALPLWVGTVTDVEDLLPPVPGLFDLVILDEAAHIDQIRAAPVLARAKRALVVGDPRQLRLAGKGATDIGVITPFRGQADALEAALLSAFPVDEIERLGLRSGTVHGFQGSEADIVIASLGLVDGDGPARHRFVADPNLFNVMVTRARRQMVVVTSLSSANGLVGDYLSYASSLAPPVASSSTVDGWVADLAAELGKAEIPVRVGYPVGGWHLDLCVGDGEAAVGLVCGVHPDGVAAHIERQETLLRAGWRLVDAFPSRWAGDPVRAALDLGPRLSG